MSDAMLVVAAHPDDEVLGCGGFMAASSARGRPVHVLILAEGITGRDPVRDVSNREAELDSLHRMAQESARRLGVASIEVLDFPDNRMDSGVLLDVVKAIEARIETHGPSTVVTHHAGDVNIDHRVAHDAVIAATRPQPGSVVNEVLFFEVASATEWRPPSSGPQFQPNYFVEITDFVQAKMDALEAYASEMRPFPHARSLEALEALARWRGSTVGVPAAEAFILGRLTYMQG